MILGITGHRPSVLGCGYSTPNPIYDKVCGELFAKFNELGVSKIISGMALGIDQWSVQVAMKMSIPYIAAVPCDNQDSRWPKESQEKFKYFLDNASEVVVVSPGAYSPEKMHIRDRWIVDHSESLLAVWNGIAKGGTYGTIRYAQSQLFNRPGYKMYRINPKI